MKNVDISDVRNFALMGHSGSGKTTLVDAMLFKLGVNDRLGSVDNGSSLSDFTEVEKHRNISIFAKPFSATYKGPRGHNCELVFTDTPGYMDFFGQVAAAARATETGLIVVDASSGVEVGTRQAWKRCAKNGVTARAVVITGLDKDNTDYVKTLTEVQASFGSNCVPVVVPLSDCSGVVDVLAAKDVPEDLAERVQEAKGSLVELAAETDDTLIEKFLEGEDLSPEEVGEGLVSAVATGGLVPVFVTMALKDIGVTELLNGVCRLFPSPPAHAMKSDTGDVIDTSPDAPFVGLVWRSVVDAFVGQMSFVRVIGGTLKTDMEVQNTQKGEREKVGGLLLVNGKKQEPIESATAGDIVAIPKLKYTGIGDTLCTPGAKVHCAQIHFPSPVCFHAVQAKTQADEDKMRVALSRLTGEDPTLKIDRNAETHQLVLQGLGDVHIDVAVERMKNQSNVEVTLGPPKVAYRETVTGQGQGHYKHKKQSGGRGQYGEVYLRVEPLPEGEEEWFVNAVVGGVIPHNFLPAVQKGLVEGMDKGALGGFPVQRVKLTVYDGSYHDVDSSEVAFKIASSRAMREAMLDARPVLLEPVMTVHITIPDSKLGDINGDLNHKRGRIMGMEAEDGLQVLTAEVPQAELFRYAAELRSMTGGQGSFEMEFARYDVVPQNVAQKVLAMVKKDLEDED